MFSKTLFAIITMSLIIISNHSYANEHKEQTATKDINTVELSDAAKAGKELFLACDSCHNETRDPPMAPPMFGVQNHYKRAYPNKVDFIEAIVSFVTKPTKEAAILIRPVEMLGLMPALPLAKIELSNIATYLYEERFQRPCKHWEIVIKTAEKANKVDEHTEQEKRKYQRFCTPKDAS